MSVDGKMCRVCLAVQKTSRFNRIFGNNGKIGQQIYELSGVKIFEFKQCPALICPKCTGNLQRAFELRNSILDNNSHFNEIYKLCRFDEYDIELATEVSSDESEIEEVEEVKIEPSTSNIVENEAYVITEYIKQEYDDNTDQYPTSANPVEDLIEIKAEVKEEPADIQEFKFEDLPEEMLQALDSDNSEDDEASLQSSKKSLSKPSGSEQEQNPQKRRKIDNLIIKNDQSSMCCYCGESFKTKTECIQHRKREHREEEESLKCRHCQMNFTHSNNLRIHIKYTHLEKTLACPKCSIKFDNQDSFKQHMKVEHNHRDFVCKICSAGFIFKSGLERHMKKHERDEHTCEHCGLKFVTEKILKSHVDFVHLKLKPYKCGSCQMSFEFKYHLQNHLFKDNCMEKSALNS